MNSHEDEGVGLSRLIFFTSLFLFSFFFIKCSGKSIRYTYTNYKNLKVPDKMVNLRSDVISKFEINFGTNIKIIDDYLLVVDQRSDKLIKIIDLKKNKLIKVFGSRGQGPDEFIGIGQIIKDPQEKHSFWIYDVSTRKLKKFNIKSILRDNFYPEKIIVLHEKSGIPISLIIAFDNRIFASGAFLKNRIASYDMDGNYIRGIGKNPVRLKKNNERFATQHSLGFSGAMAIDNRTNDIFIATSLGSIVERYDKDGNLRSTYIGPEVFFPEYEIVKAGEYYTMAYNDKTRFGYIDIDYNKVLDKLFLLYSGEYQFNKKDIDGYFGNIIYVFDVNKEKIIEQIELDKRIFTMTFSDDGSSFFGLSEKGEILKYKYACIN
ncbi:MAG: hypothetical protein H5U06_08990 [Candidatus Aminicenantes bacterium]|nr:hypothetical protein [Candidatus Aminicenantes bacterium]